MLEKRIEFGHQIHVQEKAFRFGQGFFTTTRIKQFTPLWLPEHIERLNRSLRDFNMSVFDQDSLKKICCRWPLDTQLAEGFLRILVWEEEGAAHFNLEGGPLEIMSGDMKIIFSQYQRHSSEPLLGYKSFNYWSNELAYSEAINNGFDEAIFLNEFNEITEGSRHNIFWVRDGVLFTPQPDCGLLPGIAREQIIAMAGEQGIKVVQGRFQQADLQTAEEVFISNSVRGIRKVRQLGGCFYRSGEMTAFLQNLFGQREDQVSKSRC